MVVPNPTCSTWGTNVLVMEKPLGIPQLPRLSQEEEHQRSNSSPLGEEVLFGGQTQPLATPGLDSAGGSFLKSPLLLLLFFQ